MRCIKYYNKNKEEKIRIVFSSHLQQKATETNIKTQNKLHSANAGTKSVIDNHYS